MSSAAVRKIVAELVAHPFTITRRRHLGKELGIPMRSLKPLNILEAPGKNEKRFALIISYWFENNDGASLGKLATILETQMKMHPHHANRIRTLVGNTSLKEGDVETILDVLDGSNPDSDALAKEFGIPLYFRKLYVNSNGISYDEELTPLYWTLKAWIDLRFGYATRNRLAT